MVKNARLFDNVYSFPVNVFNGQTVNSSTPVFFGGYPYLEDKTVKAITVKPVSLDPAINPDYLITLIDKNGRQLWYNQPLTDLLQTNAAGATNLKLRLCRLKAIDLQRSYYINVQGVGFIANTTLYIINFYF
jgi:hypothetical protein